MGVGENHAALWVLEPAFVDQVQHGLSERLRAAQCHVLRLAGKSEIVSEYFPSSGTGQANAVFTVI